MNSFYLVPVSDYTFVEGAQKGVSNINGPPTKFDNITEKIVGDFNLTANERAEELRDALNKFINYKKVTKDQNDEDLGKLITKVVTKTQSAIAEGKSRNKDQVIAPSDLTTTNKGTTTPVKQQSYYHTAIEKGHNLVDQDSGNEHKTPVSSTRSMMPVIEQRKIKQTKFYGRGKKMHGGWISRC